MTMKIMKAAVRFLIAFVMGFTREIRTFVFPFKSKQIVNPNFLIEIAA